MIFHRDDCTLAHDILQRANRVFCICHRGPDGDAIGSLLGVGLFMENALKKEVTFHCTDEVPGSFLFLPGAQRVQGVPEITEKDAIVFVDCAEPKLTEMHESHPEFFNGRVPSINIDHHPSNPLFGTVNFVVPDASSACEIVVGLADALGWTFTPDIATCLLTGVYTDTGGLLHSNTSPRVYRTVARLLREGACHQNIVQMVFRTVKMSTLKLWGRVLENILVTEEGGAVAAVRQGDFKAAGADYSDLTNAIDYVNAVPGMRFSLILSERDGMVKGSLRTLCEDIDVSAMASRFGGGGHRKAAGFSLSGKLKSDVRWTVVPKSRDYDNRGGGAGVDVSSSGGTDAAGD